MRERNGHVPLAGALQILGCAAGARRGRPGTQRRESCFYVRIRARTLVADYPGSRVTWAIPILAAVEVQHEARLPRNIESCQLERLAEHGAFDFDGCGAPVGTHRLEPDGHVAIVFEYEGRVGRVGGHGYLTLHAVAMRAANQLQVFVEDQPAVDRLGLALRAGRNRNECQRQPQARAHLVRTPAPPHRSLPAPSPWSRA